MSDANSIQVGGRHYKTAYEHWDLMCDFGLGPDYLRATASKYVSRWRKKGGLQDLEKALHYVNKLIEKKGLIEFGGPRNLSDAEILMDRFRQANQLTDAEHKFCKLVTYCTSEADLYEAREVLLYIMKGEDDLTPSKFDELFPPDPVPLEDSNKHADRAKG